MEAAGRKRFGQQFIAGKQKSNYACPMTNLPFPQAKILGCRPRGFWRAGKRAREIFFSENPAQPIDNA
jgi:hypothetical protein